MLRLAAQKHQLQRCGFWRRRGDSNPRDPFEPNGFQDRRFQPLTHSSVSNSNVLPIMFVSYNPWPSTLPITSRNKKLSKVFLPLYDGNEGPTPQPTQLTCGPSYFHESTEVIPAASGARREAGT